MSDIGKTFLSALADEVAESVAARLRPLLSVGRATAQRLLTVNETAVYLGRTKTAIYAMAEQGKIPVVEIDSRLFFDLEDLDRLIEKHKRHPR